MDRLTNKRTLLDSIRLSEDTKFECDEKAILEEYDTQEERKSNLGIKILLILGSYLATLAFFASFSMLIKDLQPPRPFIICLTSGIGLLISTIWLNKVYDKLIINTFSITSYMLGFALLYMGLFGMNIDKNIISMLIIPIAFSFLIITQNFTLSFISILMISFSFQSLIVFNKVYDLIHLYVSINALILTYIFLNEAKIISLSKKLSQLYNPIRVGIMISLLSGLMLIGGLYSIPISQNYIWLSSVVIIFIIMYLVSIIIKISEINTVKKKVMFGILSALILTSIIFSPSILGAILIILLSFLVNYKTGLVIGVISLIYFISQYYYDLNFSLLTKSISLFVSGIIFFLLYLFTHKKSGANEEI